MHFYYIIINITSFKEVECNVWANNRRSINFQRSFYDFQSSLYRLHSEILHQFHILRLLTKFTGLMFSNKTFSKDERKITGNFYKMIWREQLKELFYKSWIIEDPAFLI